MILFIGFCVGSLFTENYDKYVIVHVAIIVFSSSYKNLKQFIKFYTISTVIVILMLFLVVRSSEVKFHLILIQWVPGLLLSFYLIFLENDINARKKTAEQRGVALAGKKQAKDNQEQLRAQRQRGQQGRLANIGQ